MKIIYTALFVKDEEELLKMFPPIHDYVFAHHSTIKFKPKNINDISIGKEVIIKIIGRVYDDRADALIIENEKTVNSHPHITISCADGVVPYYSGEMIRKMSSNNEIKYFDQPVEIEMVEGYFDGSNDIK
jgi:hypothetical protein